VKGLQRYEALAYVDAFHNLARHLPGNQAPGASLRASLFGILRNTFMSLYRRPRHDSMVGGLDSVDDYSQGATDEAWHRDDFELDRFREVPAEGIEAALMTLSEEAALSER
jgi:DNA-directed RNA polymerase specialized sigma24 family protein